MRLIDADALKKAVSDSYSDLFRGKALEFGCEGIMAGLAMTSALIDSAETIDAVPVIRCVDCVHIECDEGATWCTHPRWVQLGGYCANGERREDATD